MHTYISSHTRANTHTFYWSLDLLVLATTPQAKPAGYITVTSMEDKSSGLRDRWVQYTNVSVKRISSWILDDCFYHLSLTQCSNCR